MSIREAVSSTLAVALVSYCSIASARFIQGDPIGLWGGLNTYLYASANPLSRRDALGLWSPGAHDVVFEKSFQGKLTPAEIRVMQTASRAFDKATQAGNLAYLHGMRSKGQDPGEALRLQHAFVFQALRDAREMSRRGDRTGALKRLAEACHPFTDVSSPMHADLDGIPKEWNPYQPLGHSPNEQIGRETIKQLTPEILEQQRRILNWAYDRVFSE